MNIGLTNPIKTMQKGKQIINRILFPHIAIILILIPIVSAFLVYALIHFDGDNPICYVAYMLAFYCLVIVCLRIPNIITYIKKIKTTNHLLVRYYNDIQFKINVSLYTSLFINIAYALFQFVLGIYHNSLWYYSMFAYYIILASMRFSLLKYTRTYKINESENLELKKTRFCGYFLLLMNIALAVIIFFIIYFNKVVKHHQITSIALATYTFLSFTFAIINFIKYKKYNSPVYNCSKSITLICTCVSMITLTSTMLNSFGNNDEKFRLIVLSLSGILVIVLTFILAIKMIIESNKKGSNLI